MTNGSQTKNTMADAAWTETDLRPIFPNAPRQTKLEGLRQCQVLVSFRGGVVPACPRDLDLRGKGIRGQR